MGNTGRKELFNTYARRTNHSPAHAARVARLCYVQAEAGKSLLDVKEYQKTLFKELGLNPPSVESEDEQKAVMERFAKQKGQGISRDYARSQQQPKAEYVAQDLGELSVWDDVPPD